MDVINTLKTYPRNYPTRHLRQANQIIPLHLKEALKDRLYEFLLAFHDSPSFADPYSRISLLYEVMSRCLVYSDEEDREARYSFAGAVSSGKAVCMGIAELFYILASISGIPIDTVIGYGQSEYHAWSLVHLPDGIYHCDLTWDLGRDSNFVYFLKGDAYMRSHKHTWLSERYPACPRDADPDRFPRIPKSEILTLCEAFQKLYQ